MNSTIFLLYLCCCIFLMDYHVGGVPSNKMMVPFPLQGKIKYQCFLFLITIRYKWLQLSIPLLVALLYTLMEPSFFPFLLMLMIVAYLLPHFSQDKKSIYILIFHLFFTAVCAFQSNIAYIYVLISIMIFCYLSQKIKFERYIKPRYTINAKLKRFMIAFFTFLMITISTYLDYEYIRYVPIEQILMYVLLYFMMRTEIDVCENLKILRTYRSRTYLSIVKCSSPNIAMYSQTQIQHVESNVSWIIILLLFLLVINGSFINFFILCISTLLLILFNHDVFIYHHILQRSILYENNIIRSFINFSINAIVFQYVAYFTIAKIYHDGNIMHSLSLIFRIGFGSCFTLLCIFFIYRLFAIYNTKIKKGALHK